MAIFMPGPLVAGISGNLGGMNFVQGRNGPFVRRGLTRTVKKTERQLGRRARFDQVVKGWVEWGPEVRESWRAAARDIRFVNRLGLPRAISGFQLFVKLNLARRALDIVWPIPPEVLLRNPAPYNVVLTASAAGAVSVAWDQPSPPSTAINYFYGARSLSSRPAHHFKNWLYLELETKAAGANNHVLTGYWDPVLGHPMEGELVAVKMATHHPMWLFSHYVEAHTVTVA
ncbi:hypothetical protein ES703_64645 [subsurface metagenome]